MKSFLFFCLVASLSVLIPTGKLYAAPSAEEIAQHIYDRDDGQDSKSTVTMTLKPDNGSARERTMEVSSKDYGELSKRLILFTSPRSIDGTSFLTWEQYEDRDTQFLYLPSLRRVRRIASDQKDRSFVNSDFSYEDLERRKVELDTYKLIGEDIFLKRPVWILERSPKSAESSQYAKSTLWVDKESYLVLQAKMYSQAGNQILKELQVHKLEKIGGIWTAMDVTMYDRDNKHTTRNVIQSITYNSGVSDDVFTKSYMERK